MKKSGFTLIELLVVIAIAGIFLSFMISTLGSGRQRALDSKNQQALTLALAQAENFYASNSTYTPTGGTQVCDDITVKSALNKVGTINTDVFCNSATAGYVTFAANSKAYPGKFVCVSSSGSSTLTSDSKTACP